MSKEYLATLIKSRRKSQFWNFQCVLPYSSFIDWRWKNQIKESCFPLILPVKNMAINKEYFTKSELTGYNLKTYHHLNGSSEAM